MTWTDRADGTSSLDMPGDDWATVQMFGRGEARGLWAFRLRRPPDEDAACVDAAGPFDTRERAKQAVERLWAGAPWPSEAAT